MRALRPANRVWWSLGALAFAPTAALAQDGGLEALNGKRISYSIVYSVNGVNPRFGPFTGARNHLQGELHISGGSVSGCIKIRNSVENTTKCLRILGSPHETEYKVR